MFSNNERQKSLKRRFLLILGVTAFIAFCCLGLMIIFWGQMLSTVPKTQRIIIGVVIIIYAFVRFSRLLRRDPGEV